MEELKNIRFRLEVIDGYRQELAERTGSEVQVNYDRELNEWTVRVVKNEATILGEIFETVEDLADAVRYMAIGARVMKCCEEV